MTTPARRYVYGGLVRRVVDADTLELDIDLGLNIWQHRQTFRLARVSAPELSTPAGIENAHKLAAKLSVGFSPGRTLPGGPSIVVVVETLKDRRDPYRRYVAEVWTAGGENLSDWLLAGGLAEPYP